MTAWLAHRQPQRLRSAIFGGIGIGLIEGGGPGENVAQALEAESLDDVTDPVGRTFRAFADQTRSDRRALAACLRGSRRLMTREEAAGITVPVLIAVGTSDEIAGSAAALGKIIPGAAGARHPQPRPHAGGGRQGLQDRRAGFSVTAEVNPRDPPSIVELPERRDQHREGRDPCHARAVAIMRPGDHAADERVAEQCEQHRCGEQRQVVEPPAPESRASIAATSSIDSSATGTWIQLIAVKSISQCCWCAARIGAICAGI